MSSEPPEARPSDFLSEDQKARQQRLLALRRKVVTEQGGGERATAPTSTAIGYTPPGEADGAGAPRSDAEKLNAFLKEMAERRKNRKHQLQIIQDFLENPVDFGVEVDDIPHGTPLSELRQRRRELHYRIALLRSVLEAFEGEMALIEQAELSALSASESAAAAAQEEFRPRFTGGEGAGAGAGADPNAGSDGR